MEPSVPERLVGVDVPHACDDALVEQHRLERRTPPREALDEEASGEGRAERLGAETRTEVLLELGRWKHVPGAEAANVTVRDARAVVEVDDGTLVRGGLLGKAAGHAQVDDEREAALEADEEVLAAPLDGRDALSGQLRLHLGRLERHRQPRVVDADARERAPEQARLEPRAVRLHLGQLRHRAAPGRTTDRPPGRECSGRRR